MKGYVVGQDINGLIVSAIHTNPKGYTVKCSKCQETFVFSSAQLGVKKKKGSGCRLCNFRGKSTELVDRITRLMYSQYRTNAKVRNLDFSITEEEFKSIVVLPCTYCGNKGIRRYEATKREYLTLCGIDRRNPELGYISGNCVSACTVCNRAKRDMSFEEFKSWVQALTKHSSKW